MASLIGSLNNLGNSLSTSAGQPADVSLSGNAFFSGEKLDLGNADLLKNTSTTLSSTTSIAMNRIAVKFTFATNVGVKR